MDDLNSKRVLITGGAGFIGSHLARRLVDLGAVVTIVDSFIPEYGGNIANLRGLETSIHLNVSDVRDQYAMRHLIKDQDILFNLAGQTGHLDSMRDPMTDLEINAKAQLSILEACRYENPGVKIVFASTRQVYGRPDYLPVDEQHPTRPVDVNGINKLSGEWFHLLYNDVYGVRACALRLTNTYGPHMRVKDSRQTFLGIWLRRILSSEPIEVWGGEQRRDFTYVDDAVDAFIRAAVSDASNGTVLNLGGLEVVSLHEVAELLIAANGSGSIEVRRFPAENKRIDIGDYFAKWSAIESLLGWRPTVPLADGLVRTLEFYREHLAAYE